MLDSSTTATSAALPHDHLATAPDDDADRQHRRFLGRRDLDPDPEVTRFTFEALPAVRVALSGRHGVGKSFITDPDTWDAAASQWGAGWGLEPSNGGWMYVSASRVQVAEATGQPGDKPRAFLARLIAGAKRGEIVTYRNGDRLDLRRANLEAMPRAEAARRRRLFT